MIENGLNPEDLLGRKFGHHVNFWSMSERKLTQRVDLGDQHQMVLELRPAHDPSKAWGFVDTVISAEDLSASVWLWHKNGDQWSVDEVITIPAEPADADDLPPLFKPFGAAPPLVTDIDLSVDDRWLYVSCWGTGELKQYDVSDPFHPRETASVRLGGIVRREPHPAAPDLPLSRWTADGGDQPRRSTGVPHELAVLGVGRRGLPRRRRGVDGQTRRRRLRRRSCPRQPILPARQRLPWPAGAPDPAPGRRRVERLVLLHQLNVRQPRSMPALTFRRQVVPCRTAAVQGPPLTGDGLAMTPLIP